MNIFEVGFLIFGISTLLCIIGTIVVIFRSIKGNPKELAYHEAGHVVLFLALNRRFKEVTIESNGKDSHAHVEGHCEDHESDDNGVNLDTIRIALAGVKSTRMFMAGNFEDQGTGDYMMISEILAKNPALLEGFKNEQELMQKLSFDTGRILTEKKDMIRVIATALLNHKTLTEAEVLALVAR